MKKQQTKYRLSQNSLSSESAYTDSVPITLKNLNGLHARPAGVLAQTASRFPYTIELLANGETVNAKSIIYIMGLGLRLNDTVVVRVHAPKKEADLVIATLKKGFETCFGESEEDARAVTDVPDSVSTPSVIADAPFAVAPEKETVRLINQSAVLTGICASKGLVRGDAFLWEALEPSYKEESSNPKADARLLEITLRKLTLEKEETREDTKNVLTAALLTVQIELLKDPSLHAKARQLISKGKSAAYAFAQAAEKVIASFSAADNPIIRERQDDLKDLRRTVLRQLTSRRTKLPRVPDGCILIAKELFTSDMAEVIRHASGVILSDGALASHATVSLRKEGIPLLIQAGPLVLQTPPDALVCLDATHQRILINPTEEQEKDFTNQLRDYRRNEQNFS